MVGQVLDNPTFWFLLASPYRTGGTAPTKQELKVESRAIVLHVSQGVSGQLGPPAYPGCNLINKFELN